MHSAATKPEYETRDKQREASWDRVHSHILKRGVALSPSWESVLNGVWLLQWQVMPASSAQQSTGDHGPIFLIYTNSKLRLAELPYNPFCVVVFFFPSTLLLYFLKWPILTTPNSYYSVSLLMTLYVYVGFCGFKESTSYFPIF